MYQIIDQTTIDGKYYVEEEWIECGERRFSGNESKLPEFDTYEEAEDYKVDQILKDFKKEELIISMLVRDIIEFCELNIDFDPNDFGLCQSLNSHLELLLFQILDIVQADDIPKGMTLEQFEQFAERLNNLTPFI